MRTWISLMKSETSSSKRIKISARATESCWSNQISTFSNQGRCRTRSWTRTIPLTMGLAEPPKRSCWRFRRSSWLIQSTPKLCLKQSPALAISPLSTLINSSCTRCRNCSWARLRMLLMRSRTICSSSPKAITITLIRNLPAIWAELGKWQSPAPNFSWAKQPPSLCPPDRGREL